MIVGNKFSFKFFYWTVKKWNKKTFFFSPFRYERCLKRTGSKDGKKVKQKSREFLKLRAYASKPYWIFNRSLKEF